MTELLMIAGMTLSVLLFSLGGTGFKWMRRFLMPSLMGIILILMGVNIYLSITSCVALMIVMCLGYGDSTPWWLKCIVALSYAIPSLIIGFSWWAFILPPAFLAMFFLSNWTPTQTSFTWKIVEGATGFLIAASMLTAGLQPWL